MIDIHNHTIYSDGEHTPEEIIVNAINNGIDTIGLSDHHKAFFMEKPQYKGFNSYVEEINNLKEKYKGKINILSGIEINLNFKYEIDERRIPYGDLEKLDYVLLERIDGLAPFASPAKYHIKFKDIGCMISKIKTKIGFAHTDILKLAEIYSDNKGLDYGLDYTLSTMEEYNIFWELNVQPQYEYFDYIIKNMNKEEVCMLFDKLKKYNIQIIPGSDTHLISFDLNINRLKEANLIASKTMGTVIVR